MEVHPSQQRLSCENCRTNKKKCRRKKPGDSHCVRCAHLGFSCASGQQRKVGRPKGKQSAFAATTNAAGIVERQRGRVEPKPRIAPFDNSGERTGALEHHLLALVERHVEATTTAFEVPTWPTFMTESWYNTFLHKKAVVSSPANLSQGTDASLWTSSFLEGSGYNAVNDPMLLSPSLGNSATSHGISQSSSFRQATYYLHGDKFSHYPGRFIFNVDISNAMAQIIRMNAGLQLRHKAIEMIHQNLSLDLVIYRKGPLYMENNSMAGYVLETSEDLLQILSVLLHHQLKSHPSLNDQTRNLVLAATSVYCQLLSFFELILELFTTRLERTSGPLIPIPGCTLNDVPVIGLSAQGALFCNTTLTLLERFDTLLGTGSNPGEGLLSVGQLGLLWDALDNGVGLTSGDGIMRPMDMQKLYVQVRGVLEQSSLFAS